MRAQISWSVMLVLGILLGPGAFAQARSNCTALVHLDLARPASRITRAAVVAAGPMRGTARGADAPRLPAHCLVEGVLEQRRGAGGHEYGIRFAVALPEQWNGRFLFQGGGGLNGTVRPPIGAQAAGGRPALARGFAVVSTDSGHEGAVFDGSFFADQQAALNFLYQAIGKVTAAAKRVVAAYYGKGPAHSYFVGCSTGGREAMIASQRYPRDFDGIVAGDPAMRTGFSNLGMRAVSVALNGIARKDAAGHPIAGSGLSASDKTLIVDAVRKACDAEDGLADGMIFNTRACRFDPAVLQCKGEKTAACLAPAQVAAVKKAFAGPDDASGRQVYPGYPYDTGIAASGTGVIPGVLNAAPSPVDPPIPPTTQDVDAEARAAATDISALGYTYGWTNLSTFAGHGGKLLFYHGVSDPWFSVEDTIGYYRKLAADNGGMQRTAQWSRLFLVPGMGHCRGGKATLDRFDMLGAVVDWVEHDKVPESVTATGADFPGRSRPLCAYPSYARYSGHGDTEDAASFTCR
jgi:feruloyl esterase